MSGADLEYERMLRDAGVTSDNAAGMDGSRLEQIGDQLGFSNEVALAKDQVIAVFAADMVDPEKVLGNSISSFLSEGITDPETMIGTAVTNRISSDITDAETVIGTSLATRVSSDVIDPVTPIGASVKDVLDAKVDPFIAAPSRIPLSFPAPKEYKTIIADTSAGYALYYGTGTLAYSLVDKKASAGSTVVTSSADGVETVVSRAISFQVSNETFKIWVKCSNWADVQSARIQIGNNHSNYFTMDVKTRMPAGSIPDNEWVELHLPRSAFTMVGSISWTGQMYITRFSVTSPVGKTATVLFNHFTRQPFKPGIMPTAGVLTIGFEGSHSSIMDAASIMEEPLYLFPATVYVTPSLLGQPGYLTQANVDDLHDRGWDIAVMGDTPLRSLSDSDLEASLAASATYGRSRAYRGSSHYAYFDGSVDSRVEAMTRKYFETARIPGFYSQPLGYISPHRISSNLISSSSTDAEINAWSQYASINSSYAEWVLPVFRKIGLDGDALSLTPTRFRAFLSYLRSQGLNVKTLSSMP